MADRWSEEQANKWYDGLPWLAGCNFIPSTAINQIEMWSADSFDADTIARELGWAAELGLNAMRVYLHDRCWAEDAAGFKERLDRYLSIAEARGIRTLFVIFDDCWHEPVAGGQPAPRAGVHNSGWARSPGEAKLMDRSSWGGLEAYVRDIVGSFGQDERVVAWDIYNEVGNYYLPVMSLPKEEREKALKEKAKSPQAEASAALLEAAFAWARAADPSQPLTAGVWRKDDPLDERLLALSDIVSFHHYREPDSLERRIDELRRHGRPLWCTEYMARTLGSTFQGHMPIFRREKVACFNWGLADGKTQTKFAWTDEPGGGEPDPWFHDIFRQDGTPYSAEEADFIRGMMGGAPASRAGAG